MAAAQKPESDLTVEEVSQSLRGRIGKKWEPKKWRPEYDRIVAYSAMGKPNTWIAETLDFTPEHVSTILNTPEAVALMMKIQAKLRENIEVNIPDVLSELAGKAVSRLREVLMDDDLFEKSPFAVVDRGLDILKGLNHLKGGGNGANPVGGGNTTNIGTVILAPGQKSDIMEGLERIAEVKRIHGGNNTSVSEVK